MAMAKWGHNLQTPLKDCIFILLLLTSLHHGSLQKGSNYGIGRGGGMGSFPWVKSYSESVGGTRYFNPSGGTGNFGEIDVETETSTPENASAHLGHSEETSNFGQINPIYPWAKSYTKDASGGGNYGGISNYGKTSSNPWTAIYHESITGNGFYGTGTDDFGKIEGYSWPKGYPKVVGGFGNMEQTGGMNTMGLNGNAVNMGGEVTEGEIKPEEQETPQPYAFQYTTKDQQGNTNYRREEGDEEGNVRGSYGYTDVEGLYRNVNYEADSNGFRANVSTNEPGVKPENPADVIMTVEETPAAVVAKYQKKSSKGKVKPLRSGFPMMPQKRFRGKGKPLGFNFPIPLQNTFVGKGKPLGFGFPPFVLQNGLSGMYGPVGTGVSVGTENGGMEIPVPNGRFEGVGTNGENGAQAEENGTGVETNRGAKDFGPYSAVQGSDVNLGSPVRFNSGAMPRWKGIKYGGYGKGKSSK